MSEQTKELGEKELSAEELEKVAGGRYDGCTGKWGPEDEEALQADYAAHGAGMSLEEFIKTRGLHEGELLARDKWIRYGSRKDSVAVASRFMDGWRVENVVGDG